MILNVFPATLNELAPPKDVLHCLQTVATMAKTIKEPTLCQLDLRGEPMVDDMSCKILLAYKKAGWMQQCEVCTPTYPLDQLTPISP